MLLTPPSPVSSYVEMFLCNRGLQRNADKTDYEVFQELSHKLCHLQVFYSSESSVKESAPIARAPSLAYAARLHVQLHLCFGKKILDCRQGRSIFLAVGKDMLH